MKMYVWSSQLLSNYGPGTIAVMAESVEDARWKVLQDYDPLCDDGKWEDTYLKCLYGMDDEEFGEALKERTEMLQEDISKEPITTDVLVIRGSD